jgi:hypothetical protein
MPVEYLTTAMERRAVEVQTLLADHGKHRARRIPDLLIAATAERAGLTVLHLDKDFELIAEITRQPVERLRIEQQPRVRSCNGERAGPCRCKGVRPIKAIEIMRRSTQSHPSMVVRRTSVFRWVPVACARAGGPRATPCLVG